MDDDVLKAMLKWPDVPAVYGWLRLDARGNWWLVQRDAPDFSQATHGLGSRISSPAILEFIWRNLSCDSAGQWYWQNGPQRVFVDIDRAPWILRLEQDPECSRPLSGIDSRGSPVTQFQSAWLSASDGALYFATPQGPACIDDRHLARLEPRLSETSGTLRINLGTQAAPVYLDVGNCQSADDALKFKRRPRPDPVR